MSQQRLDLDDSDLPASFEEILSRPSEDAERPKPIPQGTYRFIIKEVPRRGVAPKTGNGFLEFTCYPTAAGDGVQKEALDEAGGLKDKRVRYTLWVTDAAEWRITKFLDDCGIPSRDSKNKKLGHFDRLDMVVNAEFEGHVKHRVVGDAIYAEIDSTMPAG